MITFPNAKINIGLNIVQKRPDNYHNIESIFYPIPLSDILEIVPSKEETCLINLGNTINCPTDKNLVIKAYKALMCTHSLPNSKIILYKNIPDGAGLGGGSSDAAFTLKILNELYELNISDNDLMNVASSLGADCPFFLHNVPILATGIGNIFTPISLSLSGKYIILIKPDISIPTALAYSKVTPSTDFMPLAEAIELPIQEWKKYIKNDFELSIFATFPQLKEIKDFLYENGALYSSMSGSGSSIYGIFDNVIMADLIKSKYASYKFYQMKL